MTYHYRKLRREQAISPRKKSPDSISHVPENPVLQLQSLIGNRATERMVIQRMPTANQVIEILGKPKKDVRLGKLVVKKNSTKYLAVLDTLRQYHDYVGATTLGANVGEWKTQFGQIMTRLGNIDTAIAAYDGEDGDKADYMETLRGEVQLERSIASQTLMRLVTNPPRYSIAPTLLTAMMNQSNRIKTFEFNQQDVVGMERGGVNETAHVVKGGTDAYFKANKATYHDMSNPETKAQFEHHSQQANNAQLTKQVREQHAQQRENLFNESSLADEAGIDKASARSANRDLAMSRLDQLLGAEMIARAQMAVRFMPNGGKVSGSLMDKARGRAMDSRMDDTILGGPKGISMTDKNFMRLLSRLQLLDLLAGQIDRNIGNYFVKTDKDGKVIAVTGIDNEIGFGTATDITRPKRELPGISRYMDKELAMRILELDVDLLRLVMADLLSPGELDALATRLETLQRFIEPLVDELLEPDQWTDAVARGLLAENRSYYSDLNRKKNMRDKAMQDAAREGHY